MNKFYKIQGSCTATKTDSMPLNSSVRVQVTLCTYRNCMNSESSVILYRNYSWNDVFLAKSFLLNLLKPEIVEDFVSGKRECACNSLKATKTFCTNE